MMQDQDKTLARAARALSRARVVCTRKREFRAVGFLAMSLRWVPDVSVETAETDGREVRYNPAFFLSLGERERVTLVAHETLHPAYRHHTRRGARDPDRWNVAADLRINHDLAEMGFAAIEGWIYDVKISADRSTDEIYALLPESETKDPQRGRGDGGDGEPRKDYGGCGRVKDAPPEEGGVLSDAEREAEDARWKRKLQQAAQQAKAMGSLPGCFAREVQTLMNPRTNWRAILTRFFERNVTHHDYTLVPPNERYQLLGFDVPSSLKLDAPTVVIGSDVSGSVTDDEFALSTSHVARILATARPKMTHVVYWDTGFCQHDRYRPYQRVKVGTRAGGGGTNFSGFFDYVAQQGIRPRVCVFFTDLHARFPASPPPYPVIWVTWGAHGRAPWGQTVVVDRED